MKDRIRACESRIAKLQMDRPALAEQGVREMESWRDSGAFPSADFLRVFVETADEVKAVRGELEAIEKELDVEVPKAGSSHRVSMKTLKIRVDTCARRKAELDEMARREAEARRGLSLVQEILSFQAPEGPIGSFVEHARAAAAELLEAIRKDENFEDDELAGLLAFHRLVTCKTLAEKDRRRLGEKVCTWFGPAARRTLERIGDVTVGACAVTVGVETSPETAAGEEVLAEGSPSVSSLAIAPDPVAPVEPEPDPSGPVELEPDPSGSIPSEPEPPMPIEPEPEATIPVDPDLEIAARDEAFPEASVVEESVVGRPREDEVDGGPHEDERPLPSPIQEEGPVEGVAAEAGRQPEGRLDERAFWGLLVEGHLDYAYSYVRACERAGVAPPTKLPAKVFRALFLCGERGLLSDESGQVVSDDLGDLLSFVEARDDLSLAESEIFLAAILKPALFGPSANLAPEVIGMLDLSEAPPLAELQQALLGASRKGVVLTPDVLNSVHRQRDWEEVLRAYAQETDELIQLSATRTTVFADATFVLRHMLSKGQPIGKMLRAVRDGKPIQKEEMEALLARWNDTGHIEKQMDRIHRELHGTRAALAKIEYRAKQHLIRQVRDHCDHLQRWIELQNFNPRGKDDRWLGLLKSSCAEIFKSLEAAVAWMKKEPRGATSAREAAAKRLLARSLASILEVFGTIETAGEKLASPLARLQLPYALVDGVRVSEDWDVAHDDWAHVVTVLAERAVDWAVPIDALFAAAADREEHGTTLRLVELIEEEGRDDALAARLRGLRNDRLREARDGLKDFLRQTRNQVVQAHAGGLLAEKEYKEKEETLEAVDVAATVDVAAEKRRLVEVRAEVESLRKRRGADLLEQLESEAFRGIAPERIERVRDAVARNAFAVANELVERLLSDEPFPEPADHCRELLTFFPKKVERHRVLLTQASRVAEAGTALTKIAKAFDRGDRNEHVDGSTLPSEQARSAARLVLAWKGLCQPSNRPQGKELAALFTEIGFEVEEVTGQKDWQYRARERYDLTARTIEDRRVCVVPGYGSVAAGRYAVVVHRGGADASSLIHQLRDVPSGRALIVVYLGHVPVQQRKNLVRNCRERRRTVLLLDEALMLHLCSLSSFRLPVFFDCALPFTVAAPYMTTAGSAPPEMFFGREMERASVFEPGGTNLVYGGRQLGKTALLRDVERRFHDPDAGILVKWIDLAYDGPRPPETAWTVLTRALREFGIVPDEGVSSFGEQVKAWLGADTTRRMLFLLDEADHFLQEDAKGGYANLLRLKGLMEETDRRFKVVFAGLHNVQRSSRDPNSPLAHLGTPVCIGPLRDGEDGREALEMVTRPMGALGFRFENDFEVPLQILAYTNYYPSLVQIFCKHLLETLSRPEALDRLKSFPPYPVSLDDVEGIYRDNPDLRGDILNRFVWTLDLDTRYRVIALRIALATFENRQRSLPVQGHSTAWIREQVLDLWPVGFEEDPSAEGIRTLLEEMCGLGLLRETTSDHFALRNPNVLRLLGTKETIETDLLSAIEKERPQPFVAESYRNRLDEKDTWRLSALTGKQEQFLLRPDEAGQVSPFVGVVFGADVSGIDDVPASLQGALRNLGYHGLLVEQLESAKELVERIGKKEKQARSVLIVPFSIPWKPSWVWRILRRVEEKKTRVPVVFVGHGTQAWEWCRGQAGEGHEGSASPLFRVIGLKPWSDAMLRRWFEQHDFGPLNDDAGRRTVLESTGRWPSFLGDLAEAHRNDGRASWQDLLASLMHDPARRPIHLERFGILDQARKVLETMASYGEAMLPADVATMAEQPEEHVLLCLRWAELLSYVWRKEGGTFQLAAPLGRLLDVGR